MKSLNELSYQVIGCALEVYKILDQACLKLFMRKRLFMN